MKRLETASLTAVHWVAIALATLSGLIHLLLAVIIPQTALRTSFLLAGLGFLVGIALLLLNYRRRLLYLIGIPFVGVQIGLWYLVVEPTVATLHALDAVDKAAQLVLLVLLVRLYAADS